MTVDGRTGVPQGRALRLLERIIESKPSKTARGLAEWMVVVAGDRRYGPLLPDGAAASMEALLSATATSVARSLAFKRWAPVRRLLIGYHGVTLPGMTLHLVLRKRFVDEEVRCAMAEGAGQLVVLAAGYDTLAARVLSDHASLAAFDVDHPATLAAVTAARSRLRTSGRAPHRVPVDLARDDVGAALDATHAHRRDIRAIWVAEGLTMYLPESGVDRLLAAFRDATPPGSRMLLTYIDAERGRPIPLTGRLDGWARLRLALAKEPLRWSIARDELDAFLGERGLRCTSCVGDAELARRYLPDRPPGTALRVRERCALIEHAAAPCSAAT